LTEQTLNEFNSIVLKGLSSLDSLNSVSIIDTKSVQAINESKQELSRLLKNKELRLGIIGEFNAGKSTLINAILGKQVMPSSNRPCTATVSYIRFSEQEYINVVFNDGKVQKLSITDYENLTTEGTAPPDIKYIDVFLNAAFLRNNIVLVDTPGINAYNENHAKITLNALGSLHAAILLVYSKQPGSKSTIEFLKAAAENISKIFICVSKSDFLDEVQLKRVVEELPKKLSSASGISINKVWPISIASEAKQSGLSNFLNDISQFMAKEWQLIIINKLAKASMQQINKIVDILKDETGRRELIATNLLKTKPVSIKQIQAALNDKFDNQFIKEKETNILKTLKNLTTEAKNEILNNLPDKIEEYKQKLTETFDETIHTQVENNLLTIQDNSRDIIIDLYKQQLENLKDELIESLRQLLHFYFQGTWVENIDKKIISTSAKINVEFDTQLNIQSPRAIFNEVKILSQKAHKLGIWGRGIGIAYGGFWGPIIGNIAGELVGNIVYGSKVRALKEQYTSAINSSLSEWLLNLKQELEALIEKANKEVVNQVNELYLKFKTEHINNLFKKYSKEINVEFNNNASLLKEEKKIFDSISSDLVNIYNFYREIVEKFNIEDRLHIKEQLEDIERSKKDLELILYESESAKPQSKVTGKPSSLQQIPAKKDFKLRGIITVVSMVGVILLIAGIYIAGIYLYIRPMKNIQEGIHSKKVSIKPPPPGMAYIPAGWFWMGCSPNDNECNRDEKPYHKVYLDAYYIDKNDVTVDEYNKCVNAGACTAASCTGDGGDHPRNCVDWNQANAYCKWAGKELPTEAQWEKAARGTDGRIYPWGNEWDASKACFNTGNGTCAVGSYPQGASPYGVMDMAGNVLNWCRDWYNAKYYANSPDHNPTGPGSGEYRVLRGGSWGGDITGILRVSYRNNGDPSNWGGNGGFRCIRQVSK